MATAFTHAIVAGALAPLAPPGVPRGRLLLALVALSVAPDFDVAGHRLGVPYDHPLGHRGLTHSLPFAVCLGLLTAALGFPGIRRWSRPWFAVAALLSVAAASHGVLDAFTDAGLGVAFLAPFSDARWFFPWRPLATSPLSVTAFFRGPALAILRTEVLWVWLPLGAAAGAIALARRARR